MRKKRKRRSCSSVATVTAEPATGKPAPLIRVNKASAPSTSLLSSAQYSGCDGGAGGRSGVADAGGESGGEVGSPEAGGGGEGKGGGGDGDGGDGGGGDGGGDSGGGRGRTRHA